MAVNLKKQNHSGAWVNGIATLVGSAIDNKVANSIVKATPSNSTPVKEVANTNSAKMTPELQRYFDNMNNMTSPNRGYMTLKDNAKPEVPIEDVEPPKNDGGDKGGGGGGYYGVGSFTPSFQASETYMKAMEYTQSLLDKLSTGRTSYTDKVEAMLGKIENRDKFSYDFNTDPLFQASLQGYMNSGQIAMQDTMGQAAALTGGYGSSYGTTAANQAYNAHIQEAFSNLPEYYGMALDAYNQETQDMYNLLEMYSGQDQMEYDRLANAYALNSANAANIYDQEYNNFWQGQNFAEGQREFNANMAYKQSRDAVEDARYQQEYELEMAKALQKAQKDAEVTYKEPSETQMKRALEIYNAEGEDAYLKYADSLPYNLDFEKLDSYISEYGILPIDQRNFKITTDTRNWGGKNSVDHNDRITDQYNNEMSIDEYIDLLKKVGYSKSEAKKMAKAIK